MTLGGPAAATAGGFHGSRLVDWLVDMAPFGHTYFHFLFLVLVHVS
jgi:hypothetical protein